MIVGLILCCVITKQSSTITCFHSGTIANFGENENFLWLCGKFILVSVLEGIINWNGSV